MRAIFALTVAALTLAAAPAHANVTYDFIVQTTGPDLGGHTIYPLPLPGSVIASFTVADAIVESGSMSFTGGEVCGFGGCYDDTFPSYFLGYNYILESAGGDLGAIIGVIFNPDGTLSGRAILSDSFGDYNSRGTESAWGGSVGEDFPGGFTYTGYWQAQGPLPTAEPSSLALMLSAIGVMLGLSFRRKLPA